MQSLRYSQIFSDKSQVLVLTEAMHIHSLRLTLLKFSEER